MRLSTPDVTFFFIFLIFFPDQLASTLDPLCQLGYTPVRHFGWGVTISTLIDIALIRRGYCVWVNPSTGKYYCAKIDQVNEPSLGPYNDVDTLAKEMQDHAMRHYNIVGLVQERVDPT